MPNLWPLPSVIDPPRMYITLSIPNERAHRAAFWGTLHRLTQYWNWERDNARTAKEVAQVWRKVLYGESATAACFALYDLRQLGILLQRQNEQGGAWSTLYDPSPYVILKNPSPTFPNIINGIENQAALWSIAHGGQPAGIFQQQGATGGALLATSGNNDNTDPLVTFYIPASNRDMLRLYTPTGVWGAFNRYGQIVANNYPGIFPPANQHTVGAIIYLKNSESEDYPDGAYIGTYAGGHYFWSPFKGETGLVPEFTFELFLNGEWWNIESAGFTNKTPELSPEVNNMRLTMPVPFLLDQTGVETTELTPAESPFVQFRSKIEPSLDDRYQAFHFGIPRAPMVYFLPTLIGEPGSTPNLASSLDTNGDTAVQATLPAPYPAPILVDTVLPAPGLTKGFTDLVMADSGTVAHIVIPAESTLESITPKGLWEFVSNSGLDIDYYVCDANGLPTPLATHDDGLLMYGLKPANITNTWDYFPYTELPVTVETDTHLKFAQNRNSVQMYGTGYIQVDWSLTVPLPPEEPGRYRIHADVGENCVVNAPVYLGNNRWRISGQETTGNPVQPGRIAITIWDHDHVPPIPASCWHAENADFIVWTPAGSHNQMIPGSCSSPPNTQVDFNDEGATWMNTRNSMERFDLKWISGNVQIEFDAVKD